MRLAIAGFGLESVTFLPETTNEADFERGATRGQAVVTAARGTNSVLGGMIAVADSEGVNLDGIVAVNAGAAAAASDAAFDRYTAEIVTGLLSLRDLHGDQLDGCLLFLHGALATPARRRADAQVLEAVRAAMGVDFPIGVGMDLHGNLGPEIVDAATVIAGYYFSPHTDMAQTGERAARMLIKSVRGAIRPTMAIAKPDIILPSIFSATRLEPLAELIRDARLIERDTAAVLDISIFCGFAYADVPDCGMAIVVVTDDAPTQAMDVARLLSDKARALRTMLFKRELIHSVDSALARVQAAPRATRPICLLEHADRLNDSTYTLRALIDARPGPVYAPFMFDPSSAEACLRAGTGSRLCLELCGKSSPQAGEPLQVEVEVLWAGHKTMVIGGPLYTGTTLELGPTALIRIGEIMVSIISVQWSAIDLDCFEIFGLNPHDFRIILLRSKTHFRHVYESLCAEIVIVDTPDWGPADVTTLPYQFANRNAFPLSESGLTS